MRVWRINTLTWAVFLLSVVLLVYIHYDGLAYLVDAWGAREEYSHGFLVPVISLFFVWQRRDELERIPFRPSWLGLVAMVLGLGLFFVGELSTLYIIIQYAFLVALFGLVLAWIGWRGVRIVWAALLVLAFVIPLPGFLGNNLSSQLQLISSEFGVWVIRLFGISVYLEGNVIDLGVYKLQVVDACSGLRYLFPLMTLGFMVAYMYRDALWKRLLIFLSTIPITVLMNSFRIGVIGVMVEYRGIAMAEGFLHDFEGWVVFMGCLGILLLEMLILSKIGRDLKPVREVFGFDFPEPTPEGAIVNTRKLPVTLMVAVPLLAVAGVLSCTLGEREQIVPERADFSGFPTQLGEWSGSTDRMEQIYLDVLKLDDYILEDYRRTDGQSVNLYVAYYGSQTKGESAHSPRSCLPGGGWRIKSLTQQMVGGGGRGGTPHKANRVVIQKGDSRQLVYYWFQGRGRIITNEYMVKWYLFWDALTKNRSDGALVRLTTTVPLGESLDAADRRLNAFAGQLSGVLGDYVPD